MANDVPPAILGKWHNADLLLRCYRCGASVGRLVVDPVQILLCPQCGERVLLDLRPRSQEELEAAYLRFSWDAEANVLRESMGLRHSTEPKRR